MNEKFTTQKLIAATIKGLPHAFDCRYWGMANTTYKEEIALSAIQEMNIKGGDAKKFLRLCGLPKKDFPILYFYFDGHLEESMGGHYGITVIGKKFIDDYILGCVKKSYRAALSKAEGSNGGTRAIQSLNKSI